MLAAVAGVVDIGGSKNRVKFPHGRLDGIKLGRRDDEELNPGLRGDSEM